MYSIVQLKDGSILMNKGHKFYKKEIERIFYVNVMEFDGECEWRKSVVQKNSTHNHDDNIHSKDTINHEKS